MSPTPAAPRRSPVVRHRPPARVTPLRVQPAAQAGPSQGTPLPLPLRLKLGRAFAADLSQVRIHTDSHAQRMARSVGARAFTIGSSIYLGPGERITDEALLAHETAHVLQQSSTPNLQRWARGASSPGDSHEQEAQAASAAVVQGQTFAVQQRVSSPRLQRWGVSDALDYAANAANNLPGFSMLTYVLGFNPVNMSGVDRSPANLFRAVIGFLPGGNLIFEALQRHGILEQVGSWLQSQLNSLGMTASSLRQALMDFLNSLTWRDVFRLGDVWERAKRIFTGPIQRIISFLGGLVGDILRFIREAILRPVARLAEGTRGYDLLRFVLGYDPITGDPYPRTPENLIGGFMRLIGQEEKWRHLQQSGAIPRAWAWFQAQIGILLGFVSQIPQLFRTLWDMLQISDLLDIGSAFNKIRGVFGGFIGSFIGWAASAALEIMRFIFELLAPGAMPILRRAAAALSTIFRDPVRFVGNLVRAVVQGFRLFMTNIRTHLINGLVGWLTGALTGAGLTLPARWDLRGILSLVLQVLGLTWQNIRQKLVRRMGERVVAALETSFDILVTLVREGPMAAWQRILQGLQNLQEMVFGRIREWITQTIVVQAVTRLASLLTPAGAVIQAIIAIYNTIQFIRERLQQIFQVMQAIFNSITAIAAGSIAAAAGFVERTMARLVPVVISFLARLIGLGGISSAIQRIIARIRAPIDRALDRVVDWIVTQASRLASAVAGGARRAAAAVTNWWRARRRFQARDGTAHELFFQGEGRSARLMIASAPEQVRSWLAVVRRRPENAEAPKQAAADLIQRQMDDLDELASAEAAKRPPARTINVESAMQIITTNAPLLMSVSSIWGTESNPIQIADWRKYETASYAPLYLAGQASQPIPQITLQNAYRSQASKTSTQARAADPDFRAIHAATNVPYARIQVEMFRPHERKPLPDSGPTIGLTGQYQIRRGTLLKMKRPGNTEKPVLNDILKRYGYSMSGESKAGDHAHEMQLDGPNIIENIWPLNSSVNSSGGASLSTANFTIGSITKSMRDLKDENRRAGRPTWFIIRGVRSGSDTVGP